MRPDRSIFKSTTISSTFGKPQTTIQSKVSPKCTISQSPCLASGHNTKLPQKFSVAERIKAPQRLSSRRVYESRWTIFQSRFKENQVDFKQTLFSIADFLAYLFPVRNLKPTTIAGYRQLLLIIQAHVILRLVKI